MTVSRVVNRSGYASPATRAKVEVAVAELGYVPNAVARHLRSKRTKTIALVMSDITNPFFTTIARGVEDAASPHGYAVMFANTDESESEEIEYLRMLAQRQIDGVLLVPAGNSAASFRLLRAQEIPVVVLDRRVTRAVDQVRCDSEAGAYELVHHLTELGHKRIAVITGRRNISTSTDRVMGYERALRDAGLPVDPRPRHLRQLQPRRWLQTGQADPLQGAEADGDIRYQQLPRLRGDAGAARSQTCAYPTIARS